MKFLEFFLKSKFWWKFLKIQQCKIFQKCHFWGEKFQIFFANFFRAFFFSLIFFWILFLDLIILVVKNRDLLIYEVSKSIPALLDGTFNRFSMLWQYKTANVLLGNAARQDATHPLDYERFIGRHPKFNGISTFDGSRSNLRCHERVLSLWFASTIPQLTFLVPALAKNDFPDTQSRKCDGGGGQIRVKLSVGSLTPSSRSQKMSYFSRHFWVSAGPAAIWGVMSASYRFDSLVLYPNWHS